MVYIVIGVVLVVTILLLIRSEKRKARARLNKAIGGAFTREVENNIRKDIVTRELPCRVCGRPMKVPVGTLQRYHGECRKNR